MFRLISFIFTCKPCYLLESLEGPQFGVDSPLDGVSGFEDEDTEDDDGDVLEENVLHVPLRWKIRFTGI